MLPLTPTVSIPEEQIELRPIRAQGAGGQKVNKTSSAVHLRFDIRASSLPAECKERLLALADRRINEQGILVIKAQRFRTREQNAADARSRLQELVRRALIKRPKRIATRPPRASGERRLEQKSRRGQTKRLRGKVI